MFKALQHIRAKSYKLRANLVDFGGTAQKLWVLHCLDCFLPFLSVAYLSLIPSFLVSRFAYLGFQSKEIVIDMLPHTGWYRGLS